MYASTMDFFSAFEDLARKPVDVDLSFAMKALKMEKPKIIYNDNHESYRMMRKRQICPLTKEVMKDGECFKFYPEWDPYTGETSDKNDPDGPLCFDVHALIKFMFNRRTKNLWMEPDGDFEGWYGYDVGNGPLFFVSGRDYYPEHHLLRLPITDCYLTVDNNDQNPTVGPMLTDDQIEQIYKIAKNKSSTYEMRYGRYLPNFIKMCNYYKLAILSENDTKILKELYKKCYERDMILDDDLSDKEIDEQRCIWNREAVESLKHMRG